MEHNTAHRAADTLNRLIEAHVSDSPSEINVHEAMAVRDEVRDLARTLEQEPDYSLKAHEFEVGDYGVDDRGPTPSPELNTVEIVEITATRADSFETEEDKLVSEYQNNLYYPDDSLVVGVEYPNLTGDNKWYMPEARIRSE